MAHGIGGIKAAGLAPFAERFSSRGFAAVVFLRSGSPAPAGAALPSPLPSLSRSTSSPLAGGSVVAGVPERFLFLLPSPGPGEVLVRVMAAGVAPWDAIIREGKSKVGPEPPLTLGSDFSGVVEKVGPGVTDFAPADATRRRSW